MADSSHLISFRSSLLGALCELNKWTPVSKALLGVVESGSNQWYRTRLFEVANYQEAPTISKISDEISKKAIGEVVGAKEFIQSESVSTAKYAQIRDQLSDIAIAAIHGRTSGKVAVCGDGGDKLKIIEATPIITPSPTTPPTTTPPTTTPPTTTPPTTTPPTTTPPTTTPPTTTPLLPTPVEEGKVEKVEKGEKTEKTEKVEKEIFSMTEEKLTRLVQDSVSAQHAMQRGLKMESSIIKRLQEKGMKVTYMSNNDEVVRKDYTVDLEGKKVSFRISGKIDGIITMEDGSKMVLEMKTRVSRSRADTGELLQLGSYLDINGIEKGLIVEQVHGNLVIGPVRTRKELSGLIDDCLDTLATHANTFYRALESGEEARELLAEIYGAD